MTKTIIVCSKNYAKNLAVKTVFDEYFEKYELISLDTNSKVSETPIGDEEGIEGCLNRIKDAIEQNDKGNLYVAMEGILTQTKHGTFICGWTVIYNTRDNEYYYGCSAKVKVLDEIIVKTQKNIRLSDVVSSFYNCSGDEISNYGTNGILTNGEYTRTDEFIDSIKCAISTKFKKINN